jgi:hypothetical protein
MRSREKAPVEENAIYAANLDVLRLQVGESRERPFIPVIARMQCPLRSNPTYGSETRQGEENKSCDTPQRDPS